MPGISIVIVSDYAAGHEKSWTDMRKALRAWDAQEGAPPGELLVVESAAMAGEVPADIAPRFVFLDAASSYDLKNMGVKRSTGEWVALVDADCVPMPGWLQSLRSAIARHPEAAVISSKTVYPGRTVWERILSLITRAYIDPGGAGPSAFASGNAACYRKSVYQAHPLPSGLGPFAGRIQSESILRGGGSLIFEPGMTVVHDFEGWRMERDIRRHHGFSTVATRLADGRLPYAALIRAGVAAIPLIAAGKMIETVRTCFRCHRDYGVPGYQLPLAIGAVVVTHLMEIPGMLAAYRGAATPGRSAYR